MTGHPGRRLHQSLRAHSHGSCADEGRYRARLFRKAAAGPAVKPSECLNGNSVRQTKGKSQRAKVALTARQ